MTYTREDFSRSGIQFNPKNFKKGDIFWYYSVSAPYEVVSDWVGKVSVRNLVSGNLETFHISYHKFYFRLKKTAVKDTTMNHEEIKKQIDSFPGICKDGKKAVAKLLENFGYVPPKVGPIIPDGLYQHPGTKEIIVVKDNKYCYALGYGNKFTTLRADYVLTERWIKLGDLNTLIQLNRVINLSQNI